MQSLEDCVHYSLVKRSGKYSWDVLPASFDCCYTAIVMFPPVSEIISEVDDIACQQVIMSCKEVKESLILNVNIEQTCQSPNNTAASSSSSSSSLPSKSVRRDCEGWISNGTNFSYKFFPD